MEEDKLTYVFLMLKFFGPLFILAFLLYLPTIIKYRKIILKTAIWGALAYFLLEPTALYIKAWGYGSEKILTDAFQPIIQPETYVWGILLCTFVAIATLVATDKQENKKAILIPNFLMKRIKNKKLKNKLNKLF